MSRLKRPKGNETYGFFPLWNPHSSLQADAMRARRMTAAWRKKDKRRAVEMTGYGRLGKPKAGFPRCPQPLEIAQDAISTFPPPLRRGPWKSGNPKAGFPLSHRPDSSSPQNQNQRKEAWRRVASLPPPGSFFNENMLMLMMLKYMFDSGPSASAQAHEALDEQGRQGLFGLSAWTTTLPGYQLQPNLGKTTAQRNSPATCSRC